MKNTKILSSLSNHLSQRTFYRFSNILIITLFVGQLFNICFSVTAAEGGSKYWSDVRQENSIGYIAAANKALRGRVITFEPGAVVKFHVHKTPGIRYVLEGAVTVKWKDGNSERYQAGATFFEGPIGDKPARAHEVSNNGETIAKIWLVELIPQEDMKK